MISYQWVKGSNTIAVSNYLEGEKQSDNTHETSTKEYYDSESGKVFETTSVEMKEYLEKNNAKSDLDKLSLLRGRNRIGLDMTYSFNKDISALALVFDDKVKQTIREEMQKLMERINDEYIETRNYDNQGNRIREKASALIQTYEHHTSRELDLDLHYHNFISNQVIRKSDGKLTSLSNERLLENTNLLRIETNYQIAYRLQHEHGYDSYLDNSGDLRVSHDNRLIEKFSKRKQAMIELAKQKYNTDDLSKLNREQIKELVLATRKSKTKADFKNLQELWKEELLELGYDEKTFLKAIQHNRSNILSKDDYEKAFNIVLKRYDNLEGIFDKNKMYRDYLIMLSEVAKERQALLPKLEEAREMYHQLIKENELAIFKDEREREYLATNEYIQIEQEALYITTSMMREKKDDMFTLDDINRHRQEFEKEKGFQLSSDQRDVLEKIVNSKLLFINGHAGAGKTTSLEVLKRVSDERKIKLFGLAPSGKAAEELSKTLGVGQTIDSFLIEISKMSEDEKRKNFDGCIIVVDEAGMVDVRKMRQLLEFFSRYKTKVILQGDYKQIKSVEAGDFYKDMYETIKSDKELQDSFVELVSIRRQKKQQYLEITRSLSDKDFHKAFEILLNNKDKYFSEFNVEKIKQELLKDVSDTLIVASTNNLKDELNKEIRQELKSKGLVKSLKVVDTINTFEIRSIDDIKVNDTIKLDNKEYRITDIDRKTNKIQLETQSYDRKTRKILRETKEVNLTDLLNKQATRQEQKEFSINDRVITTKNNKELGVKNGEIFTVIAIKNNKLVLANKDKTVEIDINKYKHLDYAYSITTHKSQGVTVKNVLIADATNNMNANLFYVAATRGKENMKIFTNDIVATLSSAQNEQIKRTSSMFERKNKNNEKRLTKSEIAEMLILREYNNEETFNKYKKYLDDYKSTKMKIELLQKNPELLEKLKQTEQTEQKEKETVKKEREIQTPQPKPPPAPKPEYILQMEQEMRKQQEKQSQQQQKNVNYKHIDREVKNMREIMKEQENKQQEKKSTLKQLLDKMKNEKDKDKQHKEQQEQQREQQQEKEKQEQEKKQKQKGLSLER